MQKHYNVLFLCTGNSARSIMAEAILNHKGKPNFSAYSAGSHPAGAVRPEALRQLERARLPTTGLRSKAWDEFSRPGAPELHFVFTVCDNAAKEVCPIWPGQPWPGQAGSFPQRPQVLPEAHCSFPRPLPGSGLFLSTADDRQLGTGDHWIGGSGRPAVTTEFKLWNMNGTPLYTGDDILVATDGGLFTSKAQTDQGAAFGCQQGAA